MTLSSASCVAVLPAVLFLVVPAHAGEIVVPNNAPTTAGSGGYSTLMHTAERSYPRVVGPQELGGLPVGAVITGITWRRPSWIVYSDWPGVGFVADFTNQDIYLSTSNNPPGSLSTTYTDSTKAGNIAPGDTKYYQCWYRNPQNSPCGANFNASNGFMVTWQP